MILDYRLIIVQQDMFVKIMSTTRITMVSWEKFYLWYIHVYVTLTLRQPRSLTYNLSKIWRFSTEKKKVQNLISSLNGLVHRIIQVFHFNIQHADIGGHWNWTTSVVCAVSYSAMHSHELEITKYYFLLKTIYLELIRIF